jgi:hypothetical protein
MENQDKLFQSDPSKQNPSDFQSQSPPPSGGPQFNLTNHGGWGKKVRSWINKYGSSVILPIIALIILAGGIYLYASQKTQEPTLAPETENKIDFETGIQNFTKNISLQESQEQETEASEQTGIKEIIPEGRKENNTIIEKAAKGEGVTHLARRALKDYLKDKPQELTNEHKIYIEDYLKDKIGSRPLEVDEEVAFSEDLIKEAIDASLQLTDGQLKNLEKYSRLVVWE